MPKEYKYIRMSEFSDKPRIYTVENKKSGYLLGTIEWYAPWHQYVFMPQDAIFSSDCLADIIDFIKILKGAQKG
ncbi:MAG: hypothetical protein ABFD76_06765 [Smithella sp.]